MTTSPLITITRQYASGGSDIAQLVALAAWRVPELREA